MRVDNTVIQVSMSGALGPPPPSLRDPPLTTDIDLQYQTNTRDLVGHISGVKKGTEFSFRFF